MYSSVSLPTLLGRGCPIRKSPDLKMCAPPRGLSQLAASFFAFWCLGIRRTPLVAWPQFFVVISIVVITTCSTLKTDFSIVKEHSHGPQLAFWGIRKYTYISLTCQDLFCEFWWKLYERVRACPDRTCSGLIWPADYLNNGFYYPATIIYLRMTYIYRLEEI